MPRWSCLLVLGSLACGGPLDPPDDGSVPLGNRSEPSAYVRGAHPRLLVELDVAPGLGPRAGVADAVVEVLGPLLDKPGGITVRVDDEIAADQLRAEWSFDDVRALGDALFDGIGSDDEAVIHTMWLPGRYVSAAGGTVLGVAWSNRHIAMFADAIEGACDAALPTMRDRICREVEAAVWTHELGHVIGLVNNGIPMVAAHEDPAHPGHSSNGDDVMYWAYEGASVGDMLVGRLAGGGERLFEFGPESRADVAAFRAGD